MLRNDSKRSNFTEWSIDPVSRNQKQIKRKLKKVKTAATQRGKLGEKRGLRPGSESFPPRNAPSIKEIPPNTERYPKRLTLSFSVVLKSERAARQIEVLLAKSPVRRRPAKRSQRTCAPILHAVTPNPTRAKKTLIASALLRPLRSAYSPSTGAPRNCPKGKAIRKSPNILIRVACEISFEKMMLSPS